MQKSSESFADLNEIFLKNFLETKACNLSVRIRAPYFITVLQLNYCPTTYY